MGGRINRIGAVRYTESLEPGGDTQQLDGPARNSGHPGHRYASVDQDYPRERHHVGQDIRRRRCAR